MTLELDLSADFDTCDALEPVVLRSRDGRRETTIERALRRAVARREAQPSAGVYTEADTRWHFAAAAVSVPPEVGGSIVDAEGRIWRVLAVQHETLSQRWCCWSRELALAGGLNDVITIQRAEWNKGASGGLTASWSDWRVQVRARVQLDGAAVETTHRLRDARRRYRVYLAEEVLVNSNHRLLHGDEVYHVLGYEKPARIDELFVILAEQTLWPLGEAHGTGDLA